MTMNRQEYERWHHSGKQKPDRKQPLPHKDRRYGTESSISGKWFLAGAGILCLAAALVAGWIEWESLREKNAHLNYIERKVEEDSTYNPFRSFLYGDDVDTLSEDESATEDDLSDYTDDYTATPKAAQKTETTTRTNADVNSMTTMELLEQRNHDNMVKEARRKGLSTEGSTMDIIERINHDNMVKEARRKGLSTEGSTMDIIERINHDNMVKEARRKGLSTEGSTMDIIDRINHDNMVKEARRKGLSTEGSTMDIIDRINRHNLQNMGR